MTSGHMKGSGVYKLPDNPGYICQSTIPFPEVVVSDYEKSQVSCLVIASEDLAFHLPRKLKWIITQANELGIPPLLGVYCSDRGRLQVWPFSEIANQKI